MNESLEDQLKLLQFLEEIQIRKGAAVFLNIAGTGIYKQHTEPKEELTKEEALKLGDKYDNAFYFNIKGSKSPILKQMIKEGMI